ncbi:MAG TPA: hypothetical protein VF487_13155 [Chitinophagaceae bacterium]
MSHTPDCVSQYFFSNSQISQGLTLLQFTPVLSWDTNIIKPCVPVFLSNSIGEPLPITSNKNYMGAIAKKMAEDLFNASVLWTDGQPNPDLTYLDNENDFKNYLAKNFNFQLWPAYQRFFTTYFTIANFWNNLGPLLSVDAYNNAIRLFISQLFNIVDKRTFLPPLGKIRFEDTSNTTPVLDALLIAEPTFASITAIELLSIG